MFALSMLRKMMIRYMHEIMDEWCEYFSLFHRRFRSTGIGNTKSKYCVTSQLHVCICFARVAIKISLGKLSVLKASTLADMLLSTQKQCSTYSTFFSNCSVTNTQHVRRVSIQCTFCVEQIVEVVNSRSRSVIYLSSLWYQLCKPL